MILQFNLVYDGHVRQDRDAWFYHWQEGDVPTQKQVVDLLYNHLLLDGFSIDDTQYLGNHGMMVMYGGKPWAEVWIHFNSYENDQPVGEWASISWDKNWYRDNPKKKVLGNGLKIKVLDFVETSNSKQTSWHASGPWYKIVPGPVSEWPILNQGMTIHFEEGKYYADRAEGWLTLEEAKADYQKAHEAYILQFLE